MDESEARKMLIMLRHLKKILDSNPKMVAEAQEPEPEPEKAEQSDSTPYVIPVDLDAEPKPNPDEPDLARYLLCQSCKKRTECSNLARSLWRGSIINDCGLYENELGYRDGPLKLPSIGEVW